MGFRGALAALVCIGLALVVSCSSEASSSTAELTRGQKDTIISQLPIRGSRGVGRALQAVEQSQARALQHDSIR